MHAMDEHAALTVIQVAINVEEGDIPVVTVHVVISQEWGQTLTEQSLDKLHIVAHLWKVAAKTKVPLQKMYC